MRLGLINCERCSSTTTVQLRKLLPPKILKPGDQVALTTGPFANFVVEVEQIAPDRRVWVLMEFMGGQTRVAVGAEHLRALNTSGQQF